MEEGAGAGGAGAGRESLAERVGVGPAGGVEARVPLHVVLAGFEGHGKLGVRLEAEELVRWLAQLDHRFPPAFVPPAAGGGGGDPPPPRRRGGGGGHVTLDFSCQVVEAGSQVPKALEELLLLHARPVDPGAADGRFQVDVRAMERAVEGLLREANLEKAYTVVLLNPRTPEGWKSYGYRPGFSREEALRLRGERALLHASHELKMGSAFFKGHAPSPPPGDPSAERGLSRHNKFEKLDLKAETDFWAEDFLEGLEKRRAQYHEYAEFDHGRTGLDGGFEARAKALEWLWHGTREERAYVSRVLGWAPRDGAEGPSDAPLPPSAAGEEAALNATAVPAEACLVDTWVGRGRYVIVDLAAGPFSWGPLEGGVGCRTHRTLPRVERFFEELAQERGGDLQELRDDVLDVALHDMTVEAGVYDHDHHAAAETPEEAAAAQTKVILAELDVYEAFAQKFCARRTRELETCSEVQVRPPSPQPPPHPGGVPVCRQARRADAFPATLPPPLAAGAGAGPAEGAGGGAPGEAVGGGGRGAGREGPRVGDLRARRAGGGVPGVRGRRRPTGPVPRRARRDSRLRHPARRGAPHPRRPPAARAAGAVHRLRHHRRAARGPGAAGRPSGVRRRPLRPRGVQGGAPAAGAPEPGAPRVVLPGRGGAGPRPADGLRGRRGECAVAGAERGGALQDGRPPVARLGGAAGPAAARERGAARGDGRGRRPRRRPGGDARDPRVPVRHQRGARADVRRPALPGAAPGGRQRGAGGVHGGRGAACGGLHVQRAAGAVERGPLHEGRPRGRRAGPGGARADAPRAQPRPGRPGAHLSVRCPGALAGADLVFTPRRDDAQVADWTWSVGANPLSATAPGHRFSQLQADAAQRNAVVAALEASLDAVDASVRALQAQPAPPAAAEGAAERALRTAARDRHAEAVAAANRAADEFEHLDW